MFTTFESTSADKSVFASPGTSTQHQDAEHLEPPSPYYDADPDDGRAPHKPGVQDHTSLDMMEETTTYGDESQRSESLSRLPRMYRARSAKSDHSGASAPPACAQESEGDDASLVEPHLVPRRKSYPGHSLGRPQYNTSEMPKYNTPTYSDEDAPFHPLFAYERAEPASKNQDDLPGEVDHHTNGEGLVNIVGVNKQIDDVADVDAISFQGFDWSANHSEPAETIRDLQIPLSIVLRKASEQYRNQTTERRRSLSLMLPTSGRSRSLASSMDAGAKPLSLLVNHNKGSIAAAAVTHTNVNPFMADFANGTKVGQLRLNATLQIVKSRDSVYEVIWEDTPDLTEYSELVTTASNPLNGIPQADTAPRLEHVNTKLAAWTWDHCPPGTFTSAGQSEVIFGLPTPSNMGSSHPIPLAKPDSQDHPSSVPSITDLPRLSLDFAPDEEEDLEQPLPKRRASTSSSRLTAEQRRQLLGNRKLSNLASEEEHFTTHRDSLLLAHQRIFHDEVGTSATKVTATREVVDPHILQLRHDTWTQPRDGMTNDGMRHTGFVDETSPEEQVTVKVRVESPGDSSEDVYNGVRRGKTRVYVLTRESEEVDLGEMSQCLR